jgi:hypothetical protein
MNRRAIEESANVMLVRGWILDGVGPARWGWAVVEPLKRRWVGKTLADAARSLGAAEPRKEQVP